jgi:hypothetical protein
MLVTLTNGMYNDLYGCIYDYMIRVQTICVRYINNQKIN